MAKASPIASYKEPARVHVELPSGSKVSVKGVKGLGFEQEVTVTIKGKVCQVGSHWDEKGVNFTLTPESVEVLEEAGSTLDQAVEKTRKKV